MARIQSQSSMYTLIYRRPTRLGTDENWLCTLREGLTKQDELELELL
jgi:hypothetical protein